METVIVHADLNSFFATAEQAANPALRGKPVGILKARGRTCIIAASIEAKKYGVKTGSSVFEAKSLCPQIILIPADFDKYLDISLRFIDICKRYSPACEVFSLDECFLDVSQTQQFFGGPLACAVSIKEQLKAEIGEWMTVSCGISHNKMLAKLASNQIKRDGLFWITPDIVFDILDKLDLMDVLGLGWGLNAHLCKLGIETFPELRGKSLEFLYRHFGPWWSQHLYNLSRGIDNSPVIPICEIPDAKSVGRTYTTHRNLTSKAEVLRLIRNLCEETAAKARQMGLAGRYVGIALRGGSRDFNNSGGGFAAAQSFENSWYAHRTLKNYIDDGRKIFNICGQLTRDFETGYVRFCGVTLSMLTKKKYLTAPLFWTDRKREDLINSVDKLNNRFGDYTVFPGQLMCMPIIRPEVNGYFGDKAYRLRSALRED